MQHLTGWLRRAYFLARYTGQRGIDVIRIGFGDLEDNCVHLTQQKTKVEMWAPIEPILAAEMATWEKRSGPFSVLSRWETNRQKVAGKSLATGAAGNS